MSTSIPEVTANAGTYALKWNAEGIRIAIDRVSDHNHTTTGEVTIRYKPPEADDFQHLHQARLNLTSTRERASLAKYLTERREEVDWSSVLEQACILALRKHREGEPVEKVGKLPIGDHAKYLSYPLLMLSQPNLVFGSYGTAKSTVAAMTALEKGIRTLWIDYEWSKSEVNAMVTRLKEGMGLDPDLEFDYRFCYQPLADDIVSIQRAVVETGAELVIVDSVGAACGGDPLDPGAVLRYFAALRSLKVTTLSLDHVAKEARGPFGSVYKMNCARNVWETIGGARDDGHFSIGLHHRKVNSGPLLKPIGYQFTYTTDSIIPQKADARQIPEVLAGMALADQMEAAILRNGGKMKVPALAEELGRTENTISVTLSRHKQRFVSLGGGDWGVKASQGEL